MYDLRNDPRTLSMMETVPPPKPREFTEAERWYYGGMRNAANESQYRLAAGMRAMTPEELAEAVRRGYVGWASNVGCECRQGLNSILGEGPRFLL